MICLTSLPEVIDKKLFESLKDYNLSDEMHRKQVFDGVSETPESRKCSQRFYAFENKKRKNREVFNSVKNDVRNYLKTQNNNDVKIIKSRRRNILCSPRKTALCKENFNH